MSSISCSKPRICYVATSFSLETDFRFAHKQCPGLVKRGFDVCYFVQSGEAGNVNGVEIFPIKRQKSKFKKILNPWKILGRLLRQRCDAYHLSNAELLPIALVLKLITKSRVVFDFREDYVEFLRLKPYIKGPLKDLPIAITRILINLVCRSMDGVIFGDERVQASYPPIAPERQMFVHHFPLLSMFGPNPIPFSARKYDVVYLGTMSQTGGIFVMLEAIAILKKRLPGLRAIFIGQPVEYVEKRFYKFIREKGLLKTIEVTGRVPYSQVPELLNEAKVGLIGLLDVPKFKKQSASKLFEYLAKGIPCVSSDLPPERHFMISGRHGYFVQPGNPEAFAEAVYKIISNPALGQRMAEDSREHFLKQKYYAEHEIDKLAELYHYILSNPRRRVCLSS